MPDGGFLSQVLLTLHLASDAYFEVEQELNKTLEELITIYKQIREIESKNEE